jgi:hypothetical protein
MNSTNPSLGEVISSLEKLKEFLEEKLQKEQQEMLKAKLELQKYAAQGQTRRKKNG